MITCKLPGSETPFMYWLFNSYSLCGEVLLWIVLQIFWKSLNSILKAVVFLKIVLIDDFLKT